MAPINAMSVRHVDTLAPQLARAAIPAFSPHPDTISVGKWNVACIETARRSTGPDKVAEAPSGPTSQQ